MSDVTPSDSIPPVPPPSPEATRLSELETEMARLQDALLRSQADQQNQQRRHQREREDLRKYATASFIEDLLPSLDALSLGLVAANGQTEGKAVAEGFRLAIQQLRQTLQSHGLVELNPANETFNPAKHEAVAQQPSETVPEGTILQVARVGWSLHDRVLRPASVVVSSGPTSA